MQRRIEETEERYRETDRERESLRRQLETTRNDLPTVSFFIIVVVKNFTIKKGSSNIDKGIGPMP